MPPSSLLIAAAPHSHDCADRGQYSGRDYTVVIAKEKPWQEKQQSHEGESNIVLTIR
jgi:hypothetical protein